MQSCSGITTRGLTFTYSRINGFIFNTEKIGDIKYKDRIEALKKVKDANEKYIDSQLNSCITKAVRRFYNNLDLLNKRVFAQEDSLDDTEYVKTSVLKALANAEKKGLEYTPEIDPSPVRELLQEFIIFGDTSSDENKELLKKSLPLLFEEARNYLENEWMHE